MTKTWEHFRYEEDEGIATITFDRPERLNALTFEAYADIRVLTAQLALEHERIRALVLRGDGGGFCSGGDVDEIIGSLLEMDTRGVYDFARMTGACVRNMRQMPQPVIFAVDGVAAGAGAVLALASGARIFTKEATIQFLFTKVGISGGDMGVCWLLPKVVGMSRASEILMLGEKIDAETALDYGLANRVVDRDELDSAVDSYLTKLSRVSPWGVAMTKEMLNRAASMDYSTAIEAEAWTQALLMTSADFGEFHTSFKERRHPQYVGR